MPNSFNKLWIHAIWTTKDRYPYLNNSFEALVYKQIFYEFQELGCKASIVNGVSDHIHCLFLLNPQKSVTEVIKQVKGSSSYYINHNDLLEKKFSWQSGYSAFSVSESVVNKVYHYIELQKEHHKKKSFEQELNEFLKLNGLNY